MRVVQGAVPRLVRFAAFPSRLDVPTNSSHCRNVEVDGILAAPAGWGRETAACGSGMEAGRAVHPRDSTAASAGNLVVRMLSPQEDWEGEISQVFRSSPLGTAEARENKAGEPVGQDRQGRSPVLEAAPCSKGLHGSSFPAEKRARTREPGSAGCPSARKSWEMLGVREQARTLSFWAGVMCPSAQTSSWEENEGAGTVRSVLRQRCAAEGSDSKSLSQEEKQTNISPFNSCRSSFLWVILFQ